jgi:methylase of polypeptide subunit release factors
MLSTYCRHLPRIGLQDSKALRRHYTGTVQWKEKGFANTFNWFSNVVEHPPSKVKVLTAVSSTYDIIRLIDGGSAIIWHGDFNRGKNMLQSISREIKARIASRISESSEELTQRDIFFSQRQIRRDLSVYLSNILIPFEAAYKLSIPRSPDMRAACSAAFGPTQTDVLVPLREVIGAVGAHEWFKRGIRLRGLSVNIHPHFGVFAPSGRSEYVDLLNNIKMPDRIDLALDLGVGTGVLSAILLQRGVKRVIATDISARAIECARDNMSRMNCLDRVTLVQCELYPSFTSTSPALREQNSLDGGNKTEEKWTQQVNGGQLFDIVVCNPPWLPIPPDTILDAAVYDTNESMLSGFLSGLRSHLRPGTGLGLLVMSNLAELLGLRSPNSLFDMFHNAGLEVAGSLSTTPNHKRAFNELDPLHISRSNEVITLWSLRPRLNTI